MEERGDPFFSGPPQIERVVGAVLCVLVHGLSEDRGSDDHTASQELLEGVQVFFFLPAAGVLDHVGSRAWLLPTFLPPPHSSVTWRG